MRAPARRNNRNNNPEDRRRAKLRRNNIDIMKRQLAHMRLQRIEKQREFEMRTCFSETQPEETEVREPIPPEMPHPLGRLNVEFREVAPPVLPPNKTSDFKLWSPIDFIQWVYQVLNPSIDKAVFTRIAEFQLDGSAVFELATDAKMMKHLGLNDQQHSLLESEARKVVNRYHLEKFEKEMEQYMNEWWIKEARGEFEKKDDD
ncbi:unnamed protein product [Caenorhabditis nigoni]